MFAQKQYIRDYNRKEWMAKNIIGKFEKFMAQLLAGWFLKNFY